MTNQQLFPYFPLCCPLSFLVQVAATDDSAAAVNTCGRCVVRLSDATEVEADVVVSATGVAPSAAAAFLGAEVRVCAHGEWAGGRCVERKALHHDDDDDYFSFSLPLVSLSLFCTLYFIYSFLLQKFVYFCIILFASSHAMHSNHPPLILCTYQCLSTSLPPPRPRSSLATRATAACASGATCKRQCPVCLPPVTVAPCGACVRTRMASNTLRARGCRCAIGPCSYFLQYQQFICIVFQVLYYILVFNFMHVSLSIIYESSALPSVLVPPHPFPAACPVPSASAFQMRLWTQARVQGIYAAQCALQRTDALSHAWPFQVADI